MGASLYLDHPAPEAHRACAPAGGGSTMAGARLTVRWSANGPWGHVHTVGRTAPAPKGNDYWRCAGRPARRRTDTRQLIYGRSHQAEQGQFCFCAPVPRFRGEPTAIQPWATRRRHNAGGSGSLQLRLDRPPRTPGSTSGVKSSVQCRQPAGQGPDRIGSGRHVDPPGPRHAGTWRHQPVGRHSMPGDAPWMDAASSRMGRGYGRRPEPSAAQSLAA